MAKFKHRQKLPQEKTRDMIMDLCEAIASTKNSAEAAKLLGDLLGKQELEMIAKRLHIAELLLDNHTYGDIEKELKVCPNTIARVQLWLQDAGEGYRMIIERTKKKRKARHKLEEPPKLSYVKKKYPLYYWPQMLLQYWVHNATLKERRDIQNILHRLDRKKQINLELERILKQELKVHR